MLGRGAQRAGLAGAHGVLGDVDEAAGDDLHRGLGDRVGARRLGDGVEQRALQPGDEVAPVGEAARAEAQHVDQDQMRVLGLGGDQDGQRVERLGQRVAQRAGAVAALGPCGVELAAGARDDRVAGRQQQLVLAGVERVEVARGDLRLGADVADRRVEEAVGGHADDERLLQPLAMAACQLLGLQGVGAAGQPISDGAVLRRHARLQTIGKCGRNTMSRRAIRRLVKTGGTADVH